MAEHWDAPKVQKNLNDQPNGSIGITELWRVVDTYFGHRKRSDGSMQEITVQLLDRGPGNGPLRFLCRVTGDDGKSVRSNLEDSIETALIISGWSYLG